jgi:hypothetical protein
VRRDSDHGCCFSVPHVDMTTDGLLHVSWSMPYVRLCTLCEADNRSDFAL